MPAVGRVVHYVSHGTPPRPDGSQAYTAQCRAAIITEVGAWQDYPNLVEYLQDDRMQRRVTQSWNPLAASLSVQNPTGEFYNQGVTYDPGLDPDPNSTQIALCDGRAHEGGTWHWPARV